MHWALVRKKNLFVKGAMEEKMAQLSRSSIANSTAGR